MIIVSGDNKRVVDVGTSDLLFSLYSTIIKRVKSVYADMPLAVEFLQKGECSSEKALETARQMNLIRDAMAGIPVERIVYDYTDEKKIPPWQGNISPVITSAANFFTTADGKDLLYEIVCILTYSHITDQIVKII